MSPVIAFQPSINAHAHAITIPQIHVFDNTRLIGVTLPQFHDHTDINFILGISQPSSYAINNTHELIHRRINRLYCHYPLVS